MSAADATLYNVSRYLVHFTSSGGQLPPLPADASELSRHVRETAKTPADALDRILCIQSDRRLVPGPRRYGPARDRLGDSQRAVCFSEIPLGLLAPLVKRRSLWGVGFQKSVVRDGGGAPVWYLNATSDQAKVLNRLVQHAAFRLEHDHSAWTLTPLIDQPGAPGVGHFAWEREWRVPGADGYEFSAPDVSFLFAPEDEHETVTDFLAWAAGDARLQRLHLPGDRPPLGAEANYTALCDDRRRA